ncbi:MAG: response regulator [Candidatus Omnitrophota bacterium]
MKKILIADDDIESARVFERLLTKYGYEVVAEPDMRKCVKKIEDDGSIGLIVIELTLLDVKSTEILEKIREIRDKRKDISVVLLSSAPETDECTYYVVKEFGYKYKDILFKPVDFKDFLPAVQNKMDP